MQTNFEKQTKRYATKIAIIDGVLIPLFLGLAVVAIYILIPGL